MVVDSSLGPHCRGLAVARRWVHGEHSRPNHIHFRVQSSYDRSASVLVDPRLMTTLSSSSTATSKSHVAYEWIKEAITSGRYAPGYRLVLAPIATELGISVVPVREAIRLLEAEGFVTFERNVGARVALIDEAEYVDAMEALAVIEG